MNKFRRNIIKFFLFNVIFLNYFGKSHANKNLKTNQKYKKKRFSKFYWYLNDKD